LHSSGQETVIPTRRENVARGLDTALPGGWPPEIGFLVRHGVAASDLAQATRAARLCGTSADVALLADGMIDCESFYRALAAETGLPFLPDGIRATEAAAYPQGILAGLAPLAANAHGIDFALAPRGAGLVYVLQQRLPVARERLAIATPQRIVDLVMEAQRDAIAARAANALADSDPALSCRDGLSRRQTGAAAFGMGLAAIAGLLAPSGAVATLAAVCGAGFLAMVGLRLATCLTAVPVIPEQDRTPEQERRRLLPDEALPLYTIIVPLSRETRVVQRLVAALAALDYPPARLDIKLVLEQDDAETRAALAAMALPGTWETLVVAEGAPRTKPRALNAALPLARGSLLVVYDAEDVPDPLQLRQAATMFASAPEEIGCLQARLVIDNTADGWIAGLFTLEYATLFDVINPGLAALGLPVPLGGTSSHFRTGALKAVGGWDAWNVTEDADLGLRLARHGWHVADLPSATIEEAPPDLGAWMRQRSRWMKGWMQVCITHSRNPIEAFRDLGTLGFLAAVTMSFGTVGSALGFPAFLGLAIVALANGSLVNPADPSGVVFAALALTLLNAGLVAMVVPAFVALRRRKLPRLLPFVPLLPFYYLMIAMAAWRGLFELVTAPSHWNKTEHGLAKSSRTGKLTDSAGSPLPPRPGGVSG